MKRFLFFFILPALFITSCSPNKATTTGTATAPAAVHATATNLAAATSTATATIPPTLQPRLVLLPSGPDKENFEHGINPLTGLPVQDPALLDLPAVLVSISNMPPTARPQAGISFAPWIYELFIGEGTTRFMSVFYGDMPRRIPNPSGDCALNNTIFKPETTWAGNRAWLDENEDGVQQEWEAGVGGICVSLVETGSTQSLENTATDSNGYYALNTSGLKTGNSYTLHFKGSPNFQFTQPNSGNDEQDSDADPQNGEAAFVYNGQTDPSLDAGLVLINPPAAVFSASDIAPDRTYVGPIRSGRLTYNDFVRMYPAGCLVYASAGDGIRQQLKGCEIIFGEQPGVSPNTALLDIDRLKELARKNKNERQPVNYSGHLFDENPPKGGVVAKSLWTYFHAFSQSFWQYDPVSGSYLRQTDDGDGKGVFHNDTDRLTGRQLAFENLAVIMADYDVFRHGQYDIALCCGLEGFAFVFRDGQMYRVRWSTNNRAWEQNTGLLRPLHLIGTDKQPFALKPGRTWVSIMTTNSAIKDLKDGNWEALFAMPDDTAPTK